MKAKPIRIDWDALEEAFNELRADLVSYLDLVTGHVVLEGEGELDDLDDEDYSPAAPEDDATRCYVRPPDTAQKIEWLGEFLAREGVETGVASELDRATTAEEPAAEIREILNRNPEVRDAWYRYRTERIQSLIDEWLQSNGVNFTDPPPWR